MCQYGMESRPKWLSAKATEINIYLRINGACEVQSLKQGRTKKEKKNPFFPT